MARCKSCRSEETRKYYILHPEINKDRYLKEKSATRERHLVRKYGITEDVYKQMLADQGGCCAICGALEKEQFKHVLHVDHCHATGRVRGLLCRGCNHMLGVVGDNASLLLRAIEYLHGKKVAAEVIAAFMECRP